MTTAVSISDFRKRTNEIIDAVVEGEETIIVTLDDGRKFVLVPGPEWQSMDETAYLTSTAANRAALTQSLHEVNEGRIVEIEL